MADYNIEPYRTIFDSAGQSIYITKITPKFIYLDAYDDCGDLWRKGLKRKVRYHSKYIYVAVANENDNYILTHLQ
tara:strand:- start:901 stop:1125 length:225 start_codon:yes stop_codon:yes gene_type:complete